MNANSVSLYRTIYEEGRKETEEGKEIEKVDERHLELISCRWEGRERGSKYWLGPKLLDLN